MSRRPYFTSDISKCAHRTQDPAHDALHAAEVGVEPLVLHAERVRKLALDLHARVCVVMTLRCRDIIICEIAWTFYELVCATPRARQLTPRPPGKKANTPRATECTTFQHCLPCVHGPHLPARSLASTSAVAARTSSSTSSSAALAMACSCCARAAKSSLPSVSTAAWRTPQ